MKTLALPSAVLEDLQWLQRFAAVLARDADEADDLVQETLVEAWRDPPRDTSRPLRPWLGTVLRNRLRMRRRGELRREAREQQAPAAGAEARAPDREHERLEVLRILLAELQGLPAEDQRIIVRRFFEGESAAAIGRALDMPAATIRSRIHRSLGRLRSTLDERFGSRATWCAAVVTVPPAGSTVPVASNEGGSTMSITTKILLITALGGTTGIAGWALTRPAEPEPSARTGASSVDVPRDDAAPSQALAEASEPAASRTAAASDDPRARWQERVRSIRSRLPAGGGTVTAPAAPPQDAREGDVRELRRIVAACMEDLGGEASGWVTLSVHEIGAPDVGTIFAAIDVVDQSFDEPEVIECLTQSMHDHVGEAPAEPFERVSTWTIPLGMPRTPEDADAKLFGYIVGAHIGEVRFCESKAEGPVAGSVTVAIAIGESGKPESAEAEPSELPAAVVECIVTATRRWAFPAQLAGKRFERTFVLPVPGMPAGPVRER